MEFLLDVQKTKKVKTGVTTFVELFESLYITFELLKGDQ